ncbi:uncharacterized protein LOC8070423 [Sorghum bicolor]|uniref:uncharacterized protein LOC8070423 n=1 Tax=Sorghum bicolor TaxID=4558 RepID=UPI000B425C34|nr:uncharacterized protein LOC8070423 [Sorghum bicolor]|eukprot:XP_021311418.1 uncharacterized protein LOC8070423 [Sorghum bicolor]
MSRVDESSQSLHIGDGTRIHFSKDDIAMVFGIPSTGRSILPKTPKHYSGDVTYELAAGQINVKQLRSIKAAQAIVVRHHDGPMSLIEQDEFKAAFVVFVMSSLFAPCGKHDHVSEDYMHAIVHPGQIKSYDWAEYVMRRLLEAVSKLKADLSSNIKTPYIYGCSLFLQVLYLDSIDLGPLSMEHNTIPRVQCFTYDRLRSMIAADSSFTAPCSNSIVHSHRPKLRSSPGICYHWATSKYSNSQSSNQDNMLALWEVLTLMTRIFKIPLEVAGPLFVAVSDFQRQISSVESQRQLSSALGSEALKLICLLLHIMEPYANGFRYQPNISADRPPVGLCSMWQSQLRSNAHLGSATSLQLKRKSINYIGETSAPTDNDGTQNKFLHVLNNNIAGPSQMPTGLFIQAAHNVQDNNISTGKAMARFYLSGRPDKDIRCIDLNTSPTGDESGPFMCCHRERLSHIDPRSPWDLGCTYHIDAVRAAALYKKISMVEETDDPWIVHYCPKYIEVRTCAVKYQFLGKSEMEMGLVDAVLRRFKQVDDELYMNQGPARWRHFVESDFMVSLLAGCFDISDPAVRSLFCGRHICYDVSTCKFLFFPVLLQHRWVCFAWRMDDNTIIVYDPFFSSRCHTFTLSYYEHVANLLKSAMAIVADKVQLGARRSRGADPLPSA